MPPPLRCPSVASAAACTKQLYRAAPSRPFSSTTHNEQRKTRARQDLFRWLNGRGQQYRNPAPNSTNYVSLVRRGVTPRVLDEGQENHSPFPGNQAFVSQPILSEEVRDDIWKRIMQDGQSVRDVSVTLGVDMRRVAAVVRLKEVEKEWLRIVSSPYRPLLHFNLLYDDLKKKSISL